MHFTAAVMQMNGDVSERSRHSLADLRRREVNGRIIQGFSLLLNERLPAEFQDVFRFRVPLPAPGWEMDCNSPTRAPAWAPSSWRTSRW